MVEEWVVVHYIRIHLDLKNLRHGYMSIDVQGLYYIVTNNVEKWTRFTVR
jgi:hypothetical protein